MMSLQPCKILTQFFPVHTDLSMNAQRVQTQTRSLSGAVVYTTYCAAVIQQLQVELNNSVHNSVLWLLLYLHLS